MTRTVTFPAGQTSQTVTVSTQDDSLSEGQETFGASLSSPNGNGLSFSVGNQDMATVDIVDNDGRKIWYFDSEILTNVIAALTVQFDPISYSVTEGGQAELEVVLSGPADRDVTVEFTTVDDTAVCMSIQSLMC